jgi:hypothetical protein
MKFTTTIHDTAYTVVAEYVKVSEFACSIILVYCKILKRVY